MRRIEVRRAVLDMRSSVEVGAGIGSGPKIYGMMKTVTQNRTDELRIVVESALGLTLET